MLKNSSCSLAFSALMNSTGIPSSPSAFFSFGRSITAVSSLSFVLGPRSSSFICCSSSIGSSAGLSFLAHSSPMYSFYLALIDSASVRVFPCLSFSTFCPLPFPLVDVNCFTFLYTMSICPDRSRFSISSHCLVNHNFLAWSVVCIHRAPPQCYTLVLPPLFHHLKHLLSNPWFFCCSPWFLSHFLPCTLKHGLFQTVPSSIECVFFSYSDFICDVVTERFPFLWILQCVTVPLYPSPCLSRAFQFQTNLHRHQIMVSFHLLLEMCERF